MKHTLAKKKKKQTFIHWPFIINNCYLQAWIGSPGQTGLEMDATESGIIKLATILEAAQERSF